MRPPVGIIIPSSRLLIFFNRGSFPTRHVEVVLVIFLEKRRYGQNGILYLIMTVLLYNDDVHRLAVFSILLVSSIHGKGNRSQISFDDLWKLLTKYFFWFYVRFFPEAEEPEHLHDPPFLKYIPHLWPGGGRFLLPWC